jgi:tRNA G37 N-methylase TrmD
MRRIDVITIFPGLFEAFLDESIVGIAIRTGRLKVGRTAAVRGW